MVESRCEKCKGTGIVKEENGTVHACWECLTKGKLDVHSKNISDSKVKW